MNIAVITAMPQEFRAVAACLGTTGSTVAAALKTVRGRANGHEVLVVESGMGFGNAARAAGQLIREHSPDVLMSAGFCGGLVPGLLVGDIVVAEQILIASEHGLEEIPLLHTPEGLHFAARQAAGIKIVAGTYVSTEMDRTKEYLAGMLSDRHANPVVEMESGAVARIAVENGIPLLAIRAVSDDSAEELMFSVYEFCDPDLSRIRLFRVLCTVVRKPRIIPQLVRLSRGSRTAAANLSAVFMRLFAAL